MAKFTQYVITPGWLHTLAPVFYGFEECLPGHSFGPAIRDQYLLHYVLEGEGQLLKNGEVYEVSRGDIFMILPGEVTVYRTTCENPWQYAWIGFDCDITPECLKEPVIRQPDVRHIFTWIRDHCQDDNIDGKLFALTHELLWELGKKDKENLQPDSFAVNTRTYLENSYMTHVSIQTIADNLHIDRRYLTAKFREAYGMPPQQFLMQLRLEKAREFLRSGHGVSESATMAGFTDLPNFSRQYKRWSGMNPSQDAKIGNTEAK